MCKAVNIQEHPTAHTVIAKIRKRSLLNRDVIRKITTPNVGDSSTSDESSEGADDVIEVGEQFLHEVGGNIGEQHMSELVGGLYLIVYKALVVLWENFTKKFAALVRIS